MVFKTIAVGYKPQDDTLKGKLGKQQDFTWDIGKMKTDVKLVSFENMQK
jgi:hypothetical protein